MDISYAFRSIRRNPAFAVTAIVTLAIGIAGSTTMFTVIYAVLLKPLAYHDPDRLVRLPGGSTLVRYQELKASVRSYTEIGAYLSVFGNISLAGQEGPEVVRQGRASANFLISIRKSRSAWLSTIRISTCRCERLMWRFACRHHANRT